MDTEIKCKFRGSSISRMQQLPQHLGKASRLRMDCVRTKDNRRSIFDAIDESSLREAKQIMGLSPTGDNKVDAPRFHALCSEHDPLFDRQMGCYMGMVLGDYLGAPIEFLPARDSYTSSSLTSSSSPPAITITAAGSVRYPGEISNVFHLQLGQWTDDSAMGACIADSLIVHDEEEEQQSEERHVTGAAQKEKEEEEEENENETTFVGWHYSFHARDIRSRFWNWHANGYNNAFKLSTDRSPYQSVGLGGNIAKSLQVLSVAAPDNRPILPPPIATSVNTSTKITTVDGSTGRKYEDIPEFFSTVSQDSGIGGIMRLAPIPVFFAPFPVEQSMKYAALSSQITHPGHLATQAAVFLSFFLHSCMNRSANDNSKPLAFTKAVVQAFLERQTNYVTTDAVNMVNDPVSASFNEGEEAEEEEEEEVRARKVLNRLLRSNEPATSLEVAWNWTEPVLRVERCNRNRGDYYNGYPNNTGYFGSYCMDGLAVALHSFAHSSSFTECMQVCINIRGDSDSTAAVAGQMAGAFYGITSIPVALLEHTMQHDNGENMMRSAMLTAAYREAQKLLRKKAKQREGETTAEAHTRTTNRPSITHQHDNPRQTTFTKSFPVYAKQPKSQKLPSAAASASPAFAGVSTSPSHHPQSVLQRLKTLLNTNQN